MTRPPLQPNQERQHQMQFNHSSPEPGSHDLGIERRILIAMRKTLAAVIRDITPPPGMKHPLSERTIEDVRQCFELISAREKELADRDGRAREQPYYPDQQQPTQVVPMAKIAKKTPQIH